MQLLFILGSVLEGTPFDGSLHILLAVLAPLTMVVVAIVNRRLAKSDQNNDLIEKIQEVMFPFRSDWERVRPQRNPGRSSEELMLSGIEVLSQFKGEFQQLISRSPESLRSDIRKLGNESARIIRRHDNGLLTLEEWEVQRRFIGQCIGRVMRTLAHPPIR